MDEVRSMEERIVTKMPHIPTPAEIVACCARIRASWSHRTFRLRAGLPPVGRSVEMCELGFTQGVRRRTSTVEID
ncbi:MAG TPA: hypothetical protein VHC22_05800 [Pirellulales bacterium]|nr:hypothetical protein [Pirellulales bacterium]